MDSIFSKLNSINVNDKTEKKNGLTYLSWAWAWGEVKKIYPDANYTIYENTLPSGYVVNYFTDGKTSYVKTGVTINNLEHIEELPVMDYRNKSILLENMTSFDVNKTIQRSLTKALARHGLGLYIYAGEDLPEEEKENTGNEIISEKLLKGLNMAIENNKLKDETIEVILKKYGYTSTSEIKVKDYMNIVNDLKAKKE
jgi:hypothetical protein